MTMREPRTIGEWIEALQQFPENFSLLFDFDGYMGERLEPLEGVSRTQSGDALITFNHPETFEKYEGDLIDAQEDVEELKTKVWKLELENENLSDELESYKELAKALERELEEREEKEVTA